MSKPLLLHVFATFQAAGPQVRTAQLMNAFGSEYRHTVLPMDGQSQALELLDERDSVTLLSPPPTRNTIGVVGHFRDLLTERRPDLLLTYNWGTIEVALAARTLGLRAHLHHEDGFRPDEVSELKWRRNVFRRFALARAYGTIVPSRNLETIARKAWRLRKGTTHWIPNGIDLSRFAEHDGNGDLRRELGIDPAALVVGFVGHLRPEKNALRLVRAAARVFGDHPLHLLLLGAGPEQGPIEACVAELGAGDRVTLAGHRGDPRPFYRAMDVFALSSDTEQMPVALVEAMASSLPVVATDVGDVAAMLPEPQRAAVVPLGPEVEARFGDALAALAGDPERRRAWGRANRLKAEQEYSFAAMKASYAELYEGARAAGSRS